MISDLARIFRERSTARLHLLLLDCAYAKADLPKSEKQGMDQLDPAEFPSTMLCYAMPPKQTLPDGVSSKLATGLAKHLVVRDRTIGETMKLVQDEVGRMSEGKQKLWYGFSPVNDARAEVVSSRNRNIHTTKLPPLNPKVGDEWINELGMVFVWCPPGSFRMGISFNCTANVGHAVKRCCAAVVVVGCFDHCCFEQSVPRMAAWSRG